jgi:hypothetical protein
MMKKHAIHVIMLAFAVALCAVSFGTVLRNSILEDFGQYIFNWPLLGFAKDFPLFGHAMMVACHGSFDVITLSPLVPIGLWYVMKNYLKSWDDMILFLIQCLKTMIVILVTIPIMILISKIIPASTLSTAKKDVILAHFPDIINYKRIIIMDAFPSDHGAMFAWFVFIFSRYLPPVFKYIGAVAMGIALIARLTFGMHSIFDILGAIAIVYFVSAFFSHPERDAVLNHIFKTALNFISRLIPDRRKKGPLSNHQ